VADSARALERLRDLVHGERELDGDGPGDPGSLPAQVSASAARFRGAMDDDFNTPQALAAIFDLASALYAYRDQMLQGKRPGGPFREGLDALTAQARALGLLEMPAPRPEGWGFLPRPVDGARGARVRPHRLFTAPPSRVREEGWASIQARIEALVGQRDEARGRRDWARADELRAELGAMGARIEDTPAGTRWKWKSL
jgi:cysteinyl-tRNA synthetase